ncbi:uncharacterized protein LOC142340661 [Convolutriloba macropyga]|uniref:uncharacterized protein LOC142340661 n=1 Tax=Convolutriloba macropyga TaxID=536237 RepID=UPI003F51C187
MLNYTALIHNFTDTSDSSPIDLSKFSQCELIVFRILIFTQDQNYLTLFVLKLFFNSLGAIGALLVIVVYWKRARKHQSEKLIIVLSVTDLMFNTFSLASVLAIHFGALELDSVNIRNTFCILNSALFSVVTFSSMWIILLIQLNRYAAIVTPERYRMQFAASTVRCKLIVVFMLAIAVGFLCCMQFLLANRNAILVLELLWHLIRIVFVSYDAGCMVYVFSRVAKTFKAEPLMFGSRNKKMSDHNNSSRNKSLEKSGKECKDQVFLYPTFPTVTPSVAASDGTCDYLNGDHKLTKQNQLASYRTTPEKVSNVSFSTVYPSSMGLKRQRRQFSVQFLSASDCVNRIEFDKFNHKPDRKKQSCASISSACKISSTSMYNSETCEALNHRPRRGRKRRSIGLDASRKGGWGSSVNKYSPAYHQKLVTWTLFVITVAFILSNMPHFFMEAIMFVVIRFHLIQRLPNNSQRYHHSPDNSPFRNLVQVVRVVHDHHVNSIPTNITPNTALAIIKM